ncbi:MAG: APC family permease [Gemmatimonadales bacterium]
MGAPQPERHGDGLKPVLSLLDASMINVGTMVASAIFLMPAVIAAKFATPGPALLVWIVGGVVSLFGALAIAELGAAMPEAGGQFVYLSRAFGPVWGFLYGWGTAVIVNPASLAAIAVGFATYLGYFVPLDATAIKLVAMASILALTLINCFGVELGARIQNLLTFVKLAGVLGIVGAALFVSGGSAANLTPLWGGESLASMIGPFGVAMVAVLYAYDGWVEVTYVGSELRDPARDMARSIVYSTLLVTVLYVAVSLALTYVLGHAAVAGSERVASDAMVRLLGGVGATVITVTILVSTLGANHGIVFTAARIPYAMATSGQFFRWAARVSPRYRVPTTALVVQGIWSAALVLLGTYEQLATYVVFVAFLFYGLSCAAVIVLRRREPNLPRPYRAWGYPVTPIVFILFAIFLVGNSIVETPIESLIGVGLLAVGLALYYLLGWNRSARAG